MVRRLRINLENLRLSASYVKLYKTNYLQERVENHEGTDCW